jgi:hypothetical protein
MALGERLLLCVGAAQATLGRWRGNRLAGCEVFASDEEGLRRFAAALAGQRRLPMQALVDAVEEDYRTEMLPHAGGRERAAMVQRRLRQLYRTSPYHAAVLQGRDGEQRRDDRYLFAALTNAELFLPWAEVIEEARLPFAGLYLLPLVMPSLAERLGVDRAPTLVITATASGLRQTFIEDGQLRVSRLTPLVRNAIGADGADRNDIGVLVEEVGNTRLYLEALKLRGRDDPLSVTLVDIDDSLGRAVAALERQGNNIHCERVNAATLAQKLPLSVQMLADTPDALALTLLGQRSPTVNLAPAAAMRRFQVLSTQRSLYAAAGVIGVAGIAFALANVWQHRQLTAQAESQRLETMRWQEKYVAVTRQFPQVPAPLETLQRTVDAARLIAAQTRTPERAFAIVSAALDGQPEIGLRRLSWRHGESLAGSDAPRTAGARPATGAPPGGRVESIAIDAEINGFAGDLRSAIASIEGLAQRLREDPRVQSVVIARLPLNLNPASSLSGNTQERTEQGSGSTFRLVVQLRRAST